MAISAYAQDAFTKRSLNYIRTGPGIYFKLQDKLLRNQKVSILEEKSYWVKVRYNKSKEGWLSKNSLSITKSKSSYADRFLNIKAGTKVSRVGMSAAVKAFGDKIGRVDDPQIEPILDQMHAGFSESEYRRFVYPLARHKERYRSNKFYQMELKLQPKSDIISQSTLGAAIAAKIIRHYGLVEDPHLSKYLNLLSFALTENTKFYDVPFYVFVLDSDELNAFACPGGFICITEGLIKSCSDESELAAVIAHEMGHILAGHGAKETKKREPQIKAESVFAELDEETGEYSETEQEMDEMIIEMYDRIVSKRLLKYEFEADNIAAIILSNTGYDAKAIIRMIRTVKINQGDNPEHSGFDSEYFNPDEMHLRLNQVSYFVETNYSNLPKGLQLKERFLARMK
jgi:hypothetical protein